MRRRRLTGNAAALILAISLMTACSGVVREEALDKPLPEYGSVTVVEKTANGAADIFSIKDGSMYKIASKTDDIAEMQRSDGGDIIAQLVRISQGQNFDKNEIKIYRDEKVMVLDSFFSASDIQMNAEGTRLAYRSYSQDSLDSVQKLRIFDLAARKSEEIKSGVRISGSVYCWIDGENLIYYGTDDETGGKGKIYKYNAKSGTEEVFIEEINGFCMSIMPAGDGILYFESTGIEASLCFADGNGGKNIITSELAELYEAEYNSETQEVYMAGLMSGETAGALYKAELKGEEGIRRISYDFPKAVGAASTLAAGGDGLLYFTGLLEGKSSREMDVFSYAKDSRAVSRLSKDSGFYMLY
jgi:hypothetical protein